MVGSKEFRLLRSEMVPDTPRKRNLRCRIHRPANSQYKLGESLPESGKFNMSDGDKPLLRTGDKHGEYYKSNIIQERNYLQGRYDDYGNRQGL